MKPYYQDDAVTIYHGDCRDVLDGVTGIDCTVTSPPYNQMANMGDRGGMHGGGKWTRNNTEHAYADDMPETDYQVWLSEVAWSVLTATRPGGSMFFNHKVRYRDGVPIHPLDIVRRFDGWRVREEIIWHTGAVAFNARMFTPCDERIYWMVTGEDAHKWNQVGASYLNVWRMVPPSEIDGHPCPYPITLPTRCISATTDPGDLVFDPFMGTGTTLRAAKDLNRIAIGCDISEAYCEIAAKRMAQGVLDLSA